jgi:starch-binding outer membrane protein, SusD/RagB family
VRARVGLPGIKSYSDEALRHERKVELAYEGLYYWDMRRWGLSTTAFTGIRRHGLKIEKMGEDTYRYTYVEVDDEDLNYPSKMNRLPVPEKELNNNKDIEQFAEWK